MHLIDKSVGFLGSTAIVGNTIPIAVGLALSVKIKKIKKISCVFFGDGAIEEGAFYESINFAIIHKLPVLFICENNFYSVYSGLEVRQPKGRKIHEMVNAIGIETSYGDGNNVEEVAEQVKVSKDNILKGNGPQFIEFETYRWREHCGPNYDNDLGYRDEEEFRQWKKRDPLKQLIQDEDLYKFKSIEIKKEIEEAYKFAEDSPFPSQEDFKSILLSN